MRSTSLGTHSERTHVQPAPPRHAPPPPQSLRTSCYAGVAEFCTTGRTRCTRKSYARIAVIVLYSSVTILDLIRGIIHTFLFETGLEDISGLATGDRLCDSRLAALMIAYGGANLESFLVRSSILFNYARRDHGRDLVRVSSIASAFWAITLIVSSIGNIDVGDAEVPGRYAMLIRSVVSLGTFLLTFV